MDTELQEHMETQPDPLTSMETVLAELVAEIRKATSNRSRISDIDSPWLSAKEAARYIGYSVDSFRDLVKKYELPRYGPSGRQYCRDDLDEFMREPNCFKSSSDNRPKGRRTNWVNNSLLKVQARRKGKAYI